MRNGNGLKELNAAMRRLKDEPRAAMMKALSRSADRVANMQRHLAETSRDTGALIKSIQVTLPNQTTPPYSQPSGSRVAKPNEVIITVGNSDVRYAHLVEYGTAKADAQPFFWPAVRLTAKKEQASINRTVKRAMKNAWNNKPQAGGGSDD